MERRMSHVALHWEIMDGSLLLYKRNRLWLNVMNEEKKKKKNIIFLDFLYQLLYPDYYFSIVLLILPFLLLLILPLPIPLPLLPSTVDNG